MHMHVALVPERVGDLVDALPIELAIVFEAAGYVPALAMNILDQGFRGIPTVELHDHTPVVGQEWAQGGQDRDSQVVLAAKGDALRCCSPPIEPPHRLFEI